MITAIEIENLRGIGSGRLEGLAPLTILTGPNGCGKSTVLDALLIATSPEPDEALGQAVKRHRSVLGGTKWLFGSSGDHASLQVETTSGAGWQRQLDRRESCDERCQKLLLDQQARPPFSTVSMVAEPTEPAFAAETAFSVDNQYVRAQFRRPSKKLPFVHLVDPGRAVSLHRQFTTLSKAGRRDEVYALLAVLVPHFEQLEILVEDDDAPTLCVTSAGRPVPLGLAGDGVQAFVQLAFEAAVIPEGLVLLEEPEVYQHPKAIWQTARVLLANMRRGVQVVLSTHSLELIDALLGEATDDDLGQMALFNLLLEDGELKSGRRAGEDIAFARQTLENDLR